MIDKLLNVLIGLLQEKELILSPTLFSKLELMNDKVADFILKCASENEDTDMSYFDITKDDGMVSFLKNRWDEEVTDKFNSNRREKMKISRLVMVLSSKMNVQFTNTEIEHFINKYKASQKVREDEETIKLVKGQDIVFYYNEDNYQPGGGEYCSLYRSCMRYDDCSNFFKVYTDNSNASLCVLLSNDKKVEARAIVWNNIVVNGKIGIYMDRIYSINDGAEQAMKNYAEEKGWWFRVKQSNDYNEIFNGVESLYDPKLRVLLPINIRWGGSNIRKPYMDSMRFLKYTIQNNELVYCLENYSNNNDYMEMWDSQIGGYSNNNSRYINPYKAILKISQLSNISLDKIKRIDIKDGVEEYSVGDDVYVKIDISNDSIRNIIVGDPSLVAIAGEVKEFVNGRTLVVDLHNEISEYVKDNTEEVFYETISKKTISELISSSDIIKVKVVLKKLVSEYFTFFKKHFNLNDYVIVTKELSNYMDKHSLPNGAKKLVGRIYKLIETDREHIANIELRDVKWVKIVGDYTDYKSLIIPEIALEPINIMTLDNKNLKSIDYIVSLIDNDNIKPILYNLICEVLLSKYIKNSIVIKTPEIGDRIIITRDNKNLRSVNNGCIGIINDTDNGYFGVVFNEPVRNGSSLHSVCEQGWGKIIERDIFEVVNKNFKMEEFTLLINHSDSFLKVLSNNVTDFDVKRLISIFDISDDIFFENVDFTEVASAILYDDNKMKELLKEISEDNIYFYDIEHGEIIYKKQTF